MAKEAFPTMDSRKLIYSHKIPISKTKIFWDGLKEGKIYATKCKECGEIYFPPQADCNKCLSSNVEWIQLSDIGVVETFVASYLKPQGFEHYEVPYIIAIVRTNENVKIMGFIQEHDYKDIKVGMKVKITSKIQDDGFPAIIFKVLR